MKSRCEVRVIGNVGKPPEVRGQSLNLSVAVSRSRKDKDGNWIDETDWYTVSASGEKAIKDILDAGFTKGEQVYVSGNLALRKWTDREGAARVDPTVSIFSVQQIERTQKQAKKEARPEVKPATGNPDFPDDDTPF